MDVTCERCGTEYEFDETLVSERGTSVKCTNCGHVFRVSRVPAPGEVASNDKHWTIRRTSGKTVTLQSLGDLQQLITSRELTAEDEISRSGETWKRLGDIAELHVFFEAARASEGADTRVATATPTDLHSPFNRTPSAHPSSQPPARISRPSMGPIQNQAAISDRAPAAAPRSERPRRATMAAWGQPVSSIPPGGRAPAASPFVTDTSKETVADGQVTARYPAGESSISGDASTEHAPRGTVSGRPTLAMPEGRPSPSDRARASVRLPDVFPAAQQGADKGAALAKSKLYVDAEDETAWPQRPATRSTGPWIIALLGIGLAAGAVALSWQTILVKFGLGGGNPEADGVITLAEKALAHDDDENYKEAELQFTRAAALAPKDVRPVMGLATTYGAWAQSLLFAASDLEARADKDPALHGEAAALMRDSAEKAKLAKKVAQEALRLAPTDADAMVALADAIRLSGDPNAAAEQLGKAKRLAAEPSSDAFRISALLDAAEENGDMSVAKPNAERAVDANSGSVRARLVLARALIARRDVAGAREQLRTILDKYAGHPAALSLTDALDKGLPPAAPVQEVLDAGPEKGDAGTAVLGAVSPAVPPAVPPAATPPSAGPAATAAPTGKPASSGAGGGNYAKLVTSGDAAIEHGDTKNAKMFYLKAFDLRPQGSEALAGLGYVALEEGSFTEARKRFQAAAANGYADAYIGLGDTQRRLGNLEQAIEAYRGYLDRLPDGTSAGIARRQIAALEAKVAGSTTPTPAPPDPTPGAPTEPTPPSTDNPYGPSAPPEPAPPGATP